jgi:hypothetical protein
MGLDMYAWIVPAKEAGDGQVDVKLTDPIELAYWRKFNHLHGWMENLYREKGGAKDNFNCTTVRLTLDDLARLERECQDSAIFVSVQGFFFGTAELDDSDMESLEDFIEKAREAINDDDMAVFYDSWW